MLHILKAKPGDEERTCCLGAVTSGRCTCWEIVHDIEQAPLQPGGPVARSEMCSDCACRPDSPERRGDSNYSSNWEDVKSLAKGDSARHFFCHDGMRRVLREEHPDGAVIEGKPDDYDPPMRDGVAYRADGTPAYICAGFTAMREAKGRGR